MLRLISLKIVGIEERFTLAREGNLPPFSKIIVSEWFRIPRGCLQSSFVLQPALEIYESCLHRNFAQRTTIRSNLSKILVCHSGHQKQFILKQLHKYQHIWLNIAWKTLLLFLFTNYLETQVSSLIRSENQQTRVHILVITHLGANSPPTPHTLYEYHVFQHVFHISISL